MDPIYIGVDFHSRQQTICYLKTETGELVISELRQQDKEQVRAFYQQFPSPLIIGLEASGYSPWFEAMLEQLENNFIEFAMPPTFLDELNTHIADFQTALSNQQTGVGNRVMATAAIDDELADALDAKRQLDAIVRNTFHDDPARLAAWTSASHVERAPRRRQTSDASQGSTPAPPAP